MERGSCHSPHDTGFPPPPPSSLPLNNLSAFLILNDLHWGGRPYCGGCGCGSGSCFLSQSLSANQFSGRFKAGAYSDTRPRTMGIKGGRASPRLYHHLVYRIYWPFANLFYPRINTVVRACFRAQVNRSLGGNIGLGVLCNSLNPPLFK